MKNQFQRCIALDCAPNNKKVRAGATFEKIRKIMNIDITLWNNEEHHHLHCCCWRKCGEKVHLLCPLLILRALVHWWDDRVEKNQQLTFLFYRRNVSRIGVFLKSSSSCNFFIIWSRIKCDTPLERIFHGRLKELLKSGGCLCEIFFKLDLKFLTFAVFLV